MTYPPLHFQRGLDGYLTFTVEPTDEDPKRTAVTLETYADGEGPVCLQLTREEEDKLRAWLCGTDPPAYTK